MVEALRKRDCDHLWGKEETLGEYWKIVLIVRGSICVPNYILKMNINLKILISYFTN